ncbi:hypothetical protein JCM19000A_09320 [Silvimonas sp. JCM 19000]
MAFYLRADSVPELHGLTRWEQRVLLRGTFVKERMISTLVLAVVAFLTVPFGINPLMHHLVPGVTNDSGVYMAVLVVWVFVLLGARDIVMMNLLRHKIAAHRAKAPVTVQADAAHE